GTNQGERRGTDVAGLETVADVDDPDVRGHPGDDAVDHADELVLMPEVGQDADGTRHGGATVAGGDSKISGTPILVPWANRAPKKRSGSPLPLESRCWSGVSTRARRPWPSRRCAPRSPPVGAPCSSMQTLVFRRSALRPVSRCRSSKVPTISSVRTSPTVFTSWEPPPRPDWSSSRSSPRP